MRPLSAIAFEWHEEATSTNDLAKARALESPVHGIFLLASSQTKGRGSNQRHWVSEAGNFFGSLLLQPEIPHEKAQQFVPLTGHAVMDYLAQLGLEATLKAPNDVLVQGKKICGILVETVAKGSAPPSVIIGIGLNVATHPAAEKLAHPATSLAAEQIKPLPTLEKIAAGLAECFANRYHRGLKE